MYRCLFSVLLLSACQTTEYDLIIRQVMIYDGSGTPASRGDVAVSNDTIAAVGDLSRAKAQIFIDGSKLALAPGFIDTHSHHDRGLFEAPDALAVVSQG